MTPTRYAYVFLFVLLLSVARGQDEQIEPMIKGKDLTSSLRIIDSMGFIARKKDPSVGIYYANKLIEVSRRFKNDTMIGKSIWRKSRYLRKIGEYDEAEKLLEQVDSIFKKRNDLKWQVTVLSDRGNINLYKGLNEAALTNYLDALNIVEKSKANGSAGMLYANLGNLYLLSDKYDNSIEYYSKAVKYFDENKDTVSLVLTLDNLGLISTRKKDYKRALDYHFKSLKLIERLNDKNFLAESYINIGIAFAGLNEFSKALDYYKMARDIYNKLGKKLGIANVYNNIGEVLFKEGKLNEAIKYFEEGIVVARELNSFEQVSTYAENLSKCYEEIDNPSLALKYYKEYTRTRDTVINVESSKQINDLTQKLKAKEKQAEIDLLTKDKQISENKLEHNKIVNIALVVGIILTFILLSMFYFRYRDKKKANLLLEDKNKIIEEKQKEIFDSLQYAKQIQKLLLANHKLVNETLPDSFVMFKPKDIVSGDFYWAAKKEDRFYLAVCDSTGHGVPGAFMSLLNINFLNEAVIEKNIAEPNEVFNYVRKRLIDHISQEGRQDGMDGILICVNEKTRNISYAAANNAPVVITNKTLRVADTDKMPIGKGEKNESFKLYSLEIKKGDMIMLYTDGYADQFGGPKGKKFKYKPLNEMLLKNCELPVLEQEEYLYAEFDKWKGELEQVDDICILGFRL